MTKGYCGGRHDDYDDDSVLESWMLKKDGEERGTAADRVVDVVTVDR